MNTLTSIVKESGIANIIYDYKDDFETHLKYQAVMAEFKENIKIFHKEDTITCEQVTIMMWKYNKRVIDETGYAIDYNIARYSLCDEGRIRISLFDEYEQTFEINCLSFNPVIDAAFGFFNKESYLSIWEESNKHKISKNYNEYVPYQECDRFDYYY